MTHVIACAYYFMGNDADGASIGWAANPYSSLGPDEAEIWERNNETVLYKYIRTYYWGVGLVSSSARGDIKPQTDGEIVFVILCEVIGCVACGIILGTLSSMFMATRLLEEKVSNTRRAHAEHTQHTPLASPHGPHGVPQLARSPPATLAAESA